MAKSPKPDDLNEAKRIATRMLAMPPDPHKAKGAGKDKPRRRLPVSPHQRRNDRGDPEKD